jgi:hypothetical protein
MPETYQGGCHCGALRYEFEVLLRDIAHCHCTICRRSTGGIATTWITVPLTSFRWLSGTPREYASSSSCTRHFCPTCGAHLTLFTTLSPETLDVTVATLDQPQNAPAGRHIWVQSKLPWLHLDPHLPEEWQEIIE